MNENIKELVDAMLAKDASRTETAFQAAMAEKISSKLDDMRSSMAQSMFKTVAPAAEPVVEEELTIEAVDTLTEEQLDEVLTKSVEVLRECSPYLARHLVEWGQPRCRQQHPEILGRKSIWKCHVIVAMLCRGNPKSMVRRSNIPN